MYVRVAWIVIEEFNELTEIFNGRRLKLPYTVSVSAITI